MSAVPTPHEPAPDGIEPIVAYRVWLAAKNGRLHSLNASGCWVPWGWTVAKCIWGHAAPDERCSCGLYAARALEMAKRIAAHCGDGAVVGKVELAGRVIEHDAGFRAERARLVEVYPVQGSEDVAARVAQRFSVPLGEAIRMPPVGVAPPPQSAPAPVRQRGSGAGGVVWLAAVVLANLLARAADSSSVSDAWVWAFIVIALLGFVAAFAIHRGIARRFERQLRGFGTAPPPGPDP
jgi:hypothetical protein